VRHNYIRLQKLPRAFNGFTLLHISDLHVDMNQGAMRRLEELLPDLEYDICAITGDFRGATFGPFDDALEGTKRLRPHLRETVYAVLGNHDTIRMVPSLEDMGIRMLLNECVFISRGGENIYLAVLMTLITIGSITSKRRPPTLPPTPFLFCFPTPQKFIATPPTPDSTCC
jgi:uncharacterized protein